MAQGLGIRDEDQGLTGGRTSMIWVLGTSKKQCLDPTLSPKTLNPKPYTLNPKP